MPPHELVIQVSRACALERSRGGNVALAFLWDAGEGSSDEAHRGAVGHGLLHAILPWVGTKIGVGCNCMVCPQVDVLSPDF